MTTPGKYFPASPAYFPTPESTPETSACRTFRVPADDAWLGALMGAVAVLAEEWRWYPYGDMTPADAAAAWNNIINLAYEDALTFGCPVNTVDTPYWDDATDVDDELAVDEQPWYGEVVDPTVSPTELTFIERAGIWTFTGLLAIATPELGFAPAIAFNTIAPKFVIAIRTGDVGRIIRLFVDGAKTSEITDDGSGDIVAIPVLADPALGSHQIYITAE